jgi:L-cystine transport system substrate-binding protein
MIDRSVFPSSFHPTRRQFMGLPGLVFASGLAPHLLVQASGKDVLKVGFLAHYKPFSFMEGQLQGFDLDVFARLATIMNVGLQIHVEGMASLQKKIASDDIAVIGNQLLATPENRRLFDFSKSYAANQLVCVQHEDDSRDFLTLDDLFGKKLGVLANTGVEAQSRGALGKTVQSFESIDLALKQLAKKELDAVLEESLIADYYIERDALPVKITAPFAPPLVAGLAVRKGNKELAQRLSNAVQTAMNDGSLKVISVRWFGYDVSRPNVSHPARR